MARAGSRPAMSAPGPSVLETALGRALPQADRGSVPDLNEMPDAIVAEARALGSNSLARELIEYYAGLKNRPYLPAFIADVVGGTTPAARWRRGDALVPAPSLAEQLGLAREALLAPIGGYHGLRVVPDLAHWRAGDSSVGAPAKRRPDAHYRSGVPKGSINFVKPALEAAPGVEITMRRWIAARIARCLAPGQAATIEGLRASVPGLPEVQAWTEDARIAFAAVVRERSELPSAHDGVPGFRGPDAWYVGAEASSSG